MRFNLKTGSVFLAVSIVVGGMSFLFTYKAKSQSTEVSFQPFIAQRAESHFGPNPDVPLSVTYSTIARRSDGSTVHAFGTLSPAGEFGQAVEIADYRLGRSLLLEPFTKSVSTVYLSAAQLQRRRLGEKACGADENVAGAEHVQILGVDTIRLTEEASDHKVMRWVAPALDCFALRESITFSPSRNEEMVSSLIMVEPPDSMFEVPTGYTEHSPTQLESAYQLKFGKPFWGKMLPLMESRYSKSRQ